MISRSKKYRKSIEGFSPDEALPLSDALQKLMMLTPCAPSAGPTGGAGLAAPAGN